MEIYLNGELYDSRTGTDSPITNITSFEIGSGWYGRYDGLIDDFRIYDYALSPAEVAWVATHGTGTIEAQPPPPPTSTPPAASISATSPSWPPNGSKTPSGRESHVAICCSS